MLQTPWGPLNLKAVLRCRREKKKKKHIYKMESQHVDYTGCDTTK